MKKLLTAIALCSLSYGTFAQGLEIGLNTTIANTWLMNKNVFDQDEKLNPNASFGFNWGATATYYFSEKIGVGIELNSFGVVQKYSGSEDNGNLTFDAKDKVNYFEIPILFKLKTESGFYFEIGPKFGMRGKAVETYSQTPSTTNSDYNELNIEGGLSKNVTSLVFGFGGRFDLTDKLAMTAGLRFAAGLGDATVQYTESEASAHIDANDAMFGDLGFAGAYAHIPQTPPTTGIFDSSGNALYYEKTTLVTGGIQIGLTYNLFGGK